MLSEKLKLSAEKMPVSRVKICSSLFQPKENICQVRNDLSPSPLLCTKIETSSFKANVIFAFVRKKTQASSFKAKVIFAFVLKNTDFKL
jgi:hypothetical protein